MRLKKAYIEITNLCNLSCSFCQKLTRAPHAMTPAEFSYVARELSPFCKHVYLHIKGEPLLHAELSEILDICAEYDFAVDITTNGTLLAAKSSLLLEKPAIRQVNISIHSLEKEDPGYLNEVLAFAKKASADDRIFTVLRLWNLDDRHIPKDKTVLIMEKIEKAFAFEKSLSKLSETARSQRLAKKVFIAWEQTFEWPSLKAPFVSKTGRCHGLCSMIGILCDGTVVPCCLDGNGEEPLGNIFETSLENILGSAKVQTAVKGFQKGEVLLSLCSHCSFRTRFN